MTLLRYSGAYLVPMGYAMLQATVFLSLTLTSALAQTPAMPQTLGTADLPYAVKRTIHLALDVDAIRGDAARDHDSQDATTQVWFDPRYPNLLLTSAQTDSPGYRCLRVFRLKGGKAEPIFEVDGIDLQLGGPATLNGGLPEITVDQKLESPPGPARQKGSGIGRITFRYVADAAHYSNDRWPALRHSGPLRRCATGEDDTTACGNYATVSCKNISAGDQGELADCLDYNFHSQPLPPDLFADSEENLPHPPPGKPLKDAGLSSKFREAIIKEILHGDGEDMRNSSLVEGIQENAHVWAFRIGPNLPPALRVDDWTGVCGMHAFCPILFFDRKHERLMLSAQGNDLRVLSAMHHGAHDLLVNVADGCCEDDHLIYRFDGLRYRLAQTKHVQSPP